MEDVGLRDRMERKILWEKMRSEWKGRGKMEGKGRVKKRIMGRKRRELGVSERDGTDGMKGTIREREDDWEARERGK